jgi:hypothetical protein
MLPIDPRERIHKGVDIVSRATVATSAEPLSGMKQQITRLDAQEDPVPSLVEDPDWAGGKIAERLRRSAMNAPAFRSLSPQGQTTRKRRRHPPGQHRR